MSKGLGVSDVEPGGNSSSKGEIYPIATIDVLPNSGYQLAFLPLFADYTTEFDDFFDDNEGIPILNDTARSSLIEASLSMGWMQAKSHPWIRAHIAVRKGKAKNRYEEISDCTVYGIEVAVETNIGDFTRGYEFANRNLGGEDPKNYPPEKLKPRSPFVAQHLGQLKDRVDMIDIADECDFGSLLDGWKGEAYIKINWLAAHGEPIDVDLVVDFGNSRTNALLLEHDKDEAESLHRICHPLVFRENDGVAGLFQYRMDNLTELLPESWFMLHEPLFHTPGQSKEEIKFYKFGEKKGIFGTKDVLKSEHTIMPDMFRQISPAIMGERAKSILAIPPEKDIPISRMSSPKRYAYDTEKSSKYWQMRRNPWNEIPGQNQLTPLQGEVLRFVDRGLTFVEDDPPFKNGAIYSPTSETAKPNHPRAAGLVFSALTIIETAFQQANSSSMRERTGQGAIRYKRLKNIILTNPPGWTYDESAAFYEAWIIASKTFHASRQFMPIGPDDTLEEPLVRLELDEAIAAQMPFIFSEIKHLKSNGNRLIDLYGKERDGKKSLRVMTIDIGGGTVDTCVAEYLVDGDGLYNDLSFASLFKDSSTNAGDALLKQVIEDVLVPLTVRPDTDEDMKHRVKSFYAKEVPGRDKIVRLVFIPVILNWFKNLITGSRGKGEDDAIYSGLIDTTFLDELNAALIAQGLDEVTISAADFAQVDYGTLEDVIRRWLKRTADESARYAAAFNVDLIVLTGKPSELPLVKEVIAEVSPLPDCRIIAAKGYLAGDWAPLMQNGAIPDAKLVTALGASTFRALSSGLIRNWTLQRTRAGGSRRDPKIQKHYWGLVDAGLDQFTDGDSFLPRHKSVVEDYRLPMDANIGRALFLHHSRPEQVYQTRWIGPPDEKPRVVYVTLKRLFQEPEDERLGYEYSEALRMTAAYIEVDDERIDVKDKVELRLCTLPSGQTYWLDTGCFDVTLA